MWYQLGPIGFSKTNVLGKKTVRSSTGAKDDTTVWPISDVSSDITIEIGSATFELHKFPVIRKQMSKEKDVETLQISLASVRGGSEAFELAVNFCHGANVEISLSNVPMLRCTARFLEITKDCADNDLETRTEVYLKDIVFPNISNCISVLHKCESLLPVAEDINLVDRLITAIADNASKEPSEIAEDWWGESLAVLNLDFFQRALSAVKLKGLKHGLISKILIDYYAHTSQDPQQDIVEAMVSLLPTKSGESSEVPVAFLSRLLKDGIASSVSTSCTADLETRLGLLLDQSVLEDILIPANSIGNNHGPMYDTDSVLRMFSIFLNADDDDRPGSTKLSSIVKVSNLLDNYLAEIALDSDLTPTKFIALAELLPRHARAVTDGLYRAVDTYLKVHPHIKETERYGLCKTIDCQKLSQECCSHAAHNERLPILIAVQFLNLVQTRLRNNISGPNSPRNNNEKQQRINVEGSGVQGHQSHQRAKKIYTLLPI